MGMHLSKKLRRSEGEDEENKAHGEISLNVRTDRTRFIITGRKHNFEVMEAKEGRKQLYIELKKTFFKEEKLGIVTNDIRPGQEPGQRIQATFYKVEEEGQIQIKTEGEDVVVDLITENPRQGKMTQRLKGTEEQWDRTHIIPPLERKKNHLETIRTAFSGAGTKMI